MCDYRTLVAWFLPDAGRFLASGPKSQAFFDGEEECEWGSKRKRFLAIDCSLTSWLKRREPS